MRPSRQGIARGLGDGRVALCVSDRASAAMQHEVLLFFFFLKDPEVRPCSEFLVTVRGAGSSEDGR